MHMIPSAVLALAVAAGSGQAAQAPAPTGSVVESPTPSTGVPDRYRVVLITLGPGAAIWERFGHNALWIHDPVAGTDVAYHYGLFDMGEEGFLLNFLRGRMFYSMGSADPLRMIDVYRRYGRDAWVQELRLSDNRIRELQAFLEQNLLPENRVYRYDYYLDNCSTRIRDALDRALDGRLRETLDSIPSPVTFRGQSVALTAPDALLTTGMDLGLGPAADRPISRWDLAFIPMRLREDLERMEVWERGENVPFVASTRYLPNVAGPSGAADAPPADTVPPVRTPWLLLIGIVVGGAFAGAGWAASRGRGAAAMAGRVTVGAAGTIWGLVAGVLGLVLLALWTLTDHEIAWRNENLLQANPLALALVVLAPLAAVRGGSPAATRVAALLAGLSALGLVLHFLPVTAHANLPVIALALPIHVGVYLALRRLERARRARSAG